MNEDRKARSQHSMQRLYHFYMLFEVLERAHTVLWQYVCLGGRPSAFCTDTQLGQF